MSTTENVYEWCEGYETVLKKEAEQAEALYWCHNKSSIVASRNNDTIQIPSIILCTVTGFLSATGGMVNPVILGSVSIFTGILSTILSYYKFSARAEGHRVVAQLYLKIYKKLEVELALPVKQRENPQTILNEIREKLARISEVAPDVPESVLALFKKNFKDGTTSKPIMCNGLDEVIVHKEAPPGEVSGRPKVVVTLTPR